MNSTEIRRTPLYETHRRLGGRLVDFHGWELPVQYSGILAEHQAVRTACGLFDVSHMGQVTVEGRQALDFIQKINSNDAARLAPGDAMYSHMLNERGCAVDDVIVSRLGPDRFFIVVNAATADKDFAWMKAQSSGMGVELKNRSDEYGMIAFQGPRAAEAAGKIVAGAPALKRFGALECQVRGKPSLVTRTGYTGEDGFEFIVPVDITAAVWEDLTAAGKPYGVVPCGLGCRDTLRLEAGYLLYGSDIDDDHTPLEAGYGWVVKFSKKDFIGKAALERQKTEGLSRRLFGVKLLGPGVPRSGAEVFLPGGPSLGKLCSAAFSPTLQAGIGVGYLNRTDLKAGDPVEVDIRGRRVKAELAGVPFYSKKKTA